MNLSFENIAEHFTAAIFTIAAAAITWFVKTSYDKFKRDMRAIARVERISALNRARLISNKPLIEMWSSALKSGRRYIRPIDKLIIDDETHYDVSDISLVNLIVRTNFTLQAFNDDIENLYKDYVENFAPLVIQDPPGIKKFENEMKEIARLLDQTVAYIPNLESEILSVSARARVLGRVKKHSTFGYLSLLETNVFPRITSEKLSIELDRLRKEIKDKAETT